MQQASGGMPVSAEQAAQQQQQQQYAALGPPDVEQSIPRVLLSSSCVLKPCICLSTLKLGH
jgi:hypothetical protein